MNIMWLSVAPWAPTGYGQQTSVFAPRIRDAGHDIAISATNGLQYQAIEWDGITVYPGDHTSLNKRMLKHHITEHFGSSDDVQVISLWDIWPWVDPQFGGMIADFDGLNIASWIPVDSNPVTPKTRYAIDKFQVRPIAMSRFGEDKLRESGCDPLYVPHGIETDRYKPHPDRAWCRRQMGLPEDAFVIGMVAHNEGLNPSRKNFPAVLQAFSVFQRSHPDAYLYLHTEMSGVWGGLNLIGLADALGIPESALPVVNQEQYLRGGIPKEAMAVLYSAMDVLASPSYAEGFGLPIVEAQACGTPVIVSHCSSMTELAGPGWKIGGQPWFNEAAGAMWFHPSTEELLTAFELAYERRGDQTLRDECRDFAVGYDADRVFEEHWVPALAALDAPREVPPLRVLQPNRAQRRAAKRKAAA